MAGKTIGTAWVQIKPTTKGIRKAVESGFNGQQVGAAIGKDFSAGFMGMVSGITQQLTGSLINVVRSSFSGGIERADILARFPKVMEMMGYSAEDASKSIEKLRDGVTGIPTSLADVVSGTQRLAGVAKDVNKASDWMLAISDAMLGVSGDANQAALGVEQFTQVLERGVPTGQDWKTIYQTAPAIMDELAKSLGYTSGRMSGDMYEALQKGTLSVETMMDALVKLDKEGSGSMASLQSIVRQSTGGIGTQITVMRQTVENMIATVLQGGDISGYVDSLASSIQNIAPKLIESFAKVFLGIAKIVPMVVPSIVEAIIAMTPDLMSAFAAILVEISKRLPELVQVIWNNLPVVLEGLKNALVQLFNSGQFWQIMAVVGGIIFGPKLIGALGKLASKGIGSLLGTALKSSSGSLVSAIKSVAAPLKAAVKEIGGILEAGAKVIGGILRVLAKDIMEIVKTVFKGVGEAIASFFTALSNPAIIAGAGSFVAIAGAIAAAIIAIGKAIEIAAPGIRVLMNDVIMPVATFLRDTVLVVVDALTNAIISLTNGALIPLGEFLASAFISYIQTMSDALIRVTTEAVIPLMDTLSGAFTTVLRTVGDIITNVVTAALEGVAEMTRAAGEGFYYMGEGMKRALEGVQGILQVFVEMINEISDSLVAIVALATGQSVNYGRGYAWITKAAEGGIVTGIGTDTSDSNLYALSKGEYVIRAAAARQIGYDNLDRMNQEGAGVGNTVTNNITIEGYNRDPQELANYISRKIAFNTRGVL